MQKIEPVLHRSAHLGVVKPHSVQRNLISFFALDLFSVPRALIQQNASDINCQTHINAQKSTILPIASPLYNKCVFIHNKRNSICQHTVDLKRGEIVYGTLFYGYWQERSTLAKVMAERNDNECPEVWDGESVIVEINPE